MTKTVFNRSPARKQTLPAPAQPDVAALEPGALFARFACAPSGLSSDEAHRRLRQSGPNELPAPRPAHPARLFLAQVTHTLALLLWAGSGLAFLAGLPQLGWAILAIVAINAVFSFWQEYRASRLVEALAEYVRAADPDALRVDLGYGGPRSRGSCRRCGRSCLT